MPIKNNYWNRIYNWVTEASNYSTISSSHIDEDTNDICDNGLSKALTQNSQGGKPEANMDFDGHKITNLKSPILVDDIATFNLQYKPYNFYEDVSTVANTIKIYVRYPSSPSSSNPMPKNIGSDIELYGMRIFIHIKNTNVEGAMKLDIYDDRNNLYSSISVLTYRDNSSTITAGAVLADSIHELVCVRGNFGSGAEIVFLIKSISSAYAKADLSNVTSIGTNSVLRHYITNWKYHQYKPNPPLPSPNDTKNFWSYYGLRYSNNTMTIAMSHSDYYNQGSPPRTFEFTTNLNSSYEFADTNYDLICCQDTSSQLLGADQGLSWNKYTNRIIVHFWNSGNEDFTRTRGLNLILTGKAKI